MDASKKHVPVNVCVVVLGDIGRSPRMQYHAASLAEHLHNVDIIGYVHSKPMASLLTSPSTKIHELAPFPDLNLPKLLKYLFKTIWQMLTLLVALFSVRRPQYVLCQNPPAIPTLFVCSLYCAMTRSKFIIDWHNYTHTILALESSPGGLLVTVAKWIEKVFGRKAHANLCVTKAMQKDLRDNWGIESTVLYDRPFPAFQPVSTVVSHEFFVRLAEEYPSYFGAKCDADDELEGTAFTFRNANGTIQLRPKRPGLLVSSTSWTPDEDFSILFDALERYELNATNTPDEYPDLVCVITGRGPQRQFYMDLIESKNWRRVAVLTPWLEASDYPLLLASADLGVCLHTSSSGLDLPMKVVDMFGCGLPVCAINFKCLNELVRNEENGFVFENAAELAVLLSSWFTQFPNNFLLVNIKDTFQQNLRAFQTERWTENWKRNALPLLR